MLVSACLQTNRNGAEVGSGRDQRGYLHADSDSVIFLSWTEINGKLNGQMNIFFAKGNRTKNTDTSAHAFEGVSDGNNISLNFTGSIWTDGLGGKTWTGTMSANELTLVIPNKNGQLSPVKFNTGTIEQYNDAVRRITQGVTDQNVRVQAENAQAAKLQAERNAVVEGNNRVHSSLEALKSATAQLSNSLSFDALFDGYERTWEKMKADHNKLISKASEKPLTSSKLGSVESVLGMMQSDIGAFESHAGALASNLERLRSGINSVRQSQTELRSAWQNYQDAIHANTGGGSAPDINEADIQSAIKEGDQRVREGTAMAKEASARGERYFSQSNELFKKDEALVKGLRAMD